MDVGSFLTDLESSQLISVPPKSLGLLLSAYNTTLSSLLDKHARIVNKLCRRQSPSNPWFTATLRAFRSTLRHAENIWKRTHSAADWSSFKSLRNQYHKLILSSKKEYYSSLVSSASDNPKRLWQTVSKLLHCKSSSSLPTTSPGTSLADSFAFLQAKYPNSVFLSPATLPYHLRTHHLLLPLPPNFSVFTPASESEVYNIMSNCPSKQSDSDPIPTWLLKECSSVLVHTITNIINLSLISGQFHPTLEESVISPLLKKPTLDKEELSNYRPISNLSLISKIIERVVKSRLMDHLTSNS